MKKTGFLVIMAILALGAMGIGYAAWQSTLYIGGTVDSAQWDVHFGQPPAKPAPPTGGTVTGDYTDDTHLTLAITNAYPGYSGIFTVQVVNHSSIPVKAVLAEVDDSGALFSFLPPTTQTIGSSSFTDYQISVSIPTSWDNTNAGQQYTAHFTIVADQSP